jgi:3-oxoacyl-[acyl-carrier protein] reductase
MNLGLTNKRVLVTGASRGIGSAIAYRFLREGAKVCIVSRGSKSFYQTKSSFIEEFGEDKVIANQCDCTDPESLVVLSNYIKKNWGEVDIVVANIGDGHSVSDPLPDNNQWKKIWDNNFESALHTARTFLPMLRGSKGCLLFISSITAIEAFGAPVDYSTAKAAVLALSKNMARKLATEVRINVLAPGNVLFPGGSWDKKIKENPDRVKKTIRSTVPMNRFGTVEEMADAAVFLCSERAKFITGSVLVVDGGQTVGVF